MFELLWNAAFEPKKPSPNPASFPRAGLRASTPRQRALARAASFRCACSQRLLTDSPVEAAAGDRGLEQEPRGHPGPRDGRAVIGMRSGVTRTCAGQC